MGIKEYYLIKNGAILKVTGGNYKSTSTQYATIRQELGATLTISGSPTIETSGAGNGSRAISSYGNLTITGGTVKHTNKGIAVYNFGEMTINGSNVLITSNSTDGTLPTFINDPTGTLKFQKGTISNTRKGYVLWNRGGTYNNSTKEVKLTGTGGNGIITKP